ncbi:hypothetical protein [Aliarcobacter butzleri]|uniref:hypothetical protein n=1 Tax=Aliarcobacter butzleri TaxID=28197 RepID=UPI0012699BE9|nr:hypothetical protein [Aliarcobacter butzleri]
MFKILFLTLLGLTYSYGYCPPCQCTETSSATETMEYQQEINKTIEEKLNPKIEEISQKANKAKELQKQINDKLEKLKNVETKIFVLNKEKNFYLENIKLQLAAGADITSVENQALTETIKNQINLLSSYQGQDINLVVEDYLKK